MIAHSLKGEEFGPAQKLHGVTFVVDATFRRPQLDRNELVVDIGRAGEQLKLVLADLNYRNLDDDKTLAGKNTTTEFLAREVFERLAKAIRDGVLGTEGQGIESLCITLRESHIAWGSYEGPV